MDHKKKEFWAVLLALKMEEKKRWCVRPIFQKRRSRGASILIEEMLLSDTESYFNLFPMSPQLFDNLLAVVGPAPPKSGSRFPNYKGTFTIILLAYVDANYKFVLADIGAEGHNSDGGVFKNSIFGQSLEKALQLPCPLEIPSTTNMLPFLFIEDEAFPLKNNLRPYPDVAL
ncbi:DDE Tnp4 domain-containing protein [Trichonephila clavipes]|nr:DDE Tnp4 domain-containing protein [Trichonephila clavipes]